MYAIIKTGGKQIKVAKGDTISVERLAGDAGAKVSFDEVLLINDNGKMTVGSPVVKGATVSATVVEQKRADKVIVFKKKRRQNYRRKKGHRQYVTVVAIDAITAGAKKAAAKKDAAAE